MATVNDQGKIIPKIKISENVAKITTPGFKELYRFYENETGKAMADVIALRDEEIPEDNYEIFHPVYTWKRKTLTDYTAKKVLVQIYDKGKLVYKLPNLEEIKEKAERELDTLWEETKRLDNPNEYIVELSEKLWEVKDQLLKKHGKN